jgi:hypothetical protein
MAKVSRCRNNHEITSIQCFVILSEAKDLLFVAGARKMNLRLATGN